MPGNEAGGYRSGFAAIVGRPNVGKSTLLNALVGRKLAIVSDKPQTTRNRILGVLNLEGAQAVFIDTPGIHKPHHKLGEMMVRLARNVLDEVDLVLFVVDASAPLGTGDRMIAGHLAATATPAFLVANKIDRLPAGDLQPALATYGALHRFAGVYPISALRGAGLDELLAAILARLPEGPQYYPEGMVTDQPEQFIIAELIREKVLLLTREEVPHSVAVQIEEMTPRSGNLVYVKATIHVERDSQKGIIIGEGGRLLKEIGSLARAETENLLGTRLYLDLWVKVTPDWRNRESTLRSLGYRLDR